MFISLSCGSCGEQRTDCSARRSAQVILYIYTFPGKGWGVKKNKKKQNKKKCNFLSCTEEVFAHSGSKLTTPSTRFRLVHWAHDTPLHGVCSAGNTRRVCKQLGWASVSPVSPTLLSLFFPSLRSSCRVTELDAPSWPGGLDGQQRAACDREWRTGWVGGEVSVRLL